MEDKHVTILLPQDILEAMKITEDDQLVLKVTEDGGILSKKEVKKYGLEIPTLAVVFLISLLTFFFTFHKYKLIPLTGQLSIATLIIVVGVLTGMTNFTRYFIKYKKSKESMISKGIYWRNFPTVFLSYSVLLILVLLMVFRVLGQLFVGASFDIYTSTVIGTLFVLVVNMGMINIAKSLTPSLLIRSLIAIILGGVTIAMITNKDQQWWLHNLSFLGTPEASNAWQFNVTLMLSALLMGALIDYLFVLLFEKLGKTKRLITFKVLLVLMAICLGGVGFFPYNESPFSQQMHNRSAGYLVYLFIIMIVALRWLLPSISKGFLRFSYVVAVVLVGAVLLFQGVHYLSLTAFELIAFVLAFTWLLMLLRILVNMVMNVGQEIIVDVKQV